MVTREIRQKIRHGCMSKYQIKNDMTITEDDIENLSNIELLTNQKWFVKVVSLIEGNSFGELALINDKPRAATITCEQDCTLGFISRNDYKRILEKIERRYIEKRISFFGDLQFISHLTKGQVKNMTYGFTKAEHLRGQVL